MTPFLRLALLLGASFYALFLAVVARMLGWGIAAGVAVVGGILMVALTVELVPDEKPTIETAKPEETRDGAPTYRLGFRERGEIERDARDSRDVA